MSVREIVSVALSRLTPDPDQPRKHFSEESLLGLAKTMAECQLHPILAYERDGRLVILDGERRWRAAKLAGLPSVDVQIVIAPCQGAEALEKALIANIQREDLSPIEKARAIARLMEAAGVTASEVSMKLGLSPGSVSRLLALLELPETVQDQVERGELAASTAYQIARAGEGAEQERLAAEVVAGGLTRDAVAGRRRSKAKLPARKAAARPAARLVANLGGGRTVTLSGSELSSLDTVITWLEELLAKARKARPRGMEPATFLALLRDEAKTAEHAKQGSPDGGGAA